MIITESSLLHTHTFTPHITFEISDDELTSLTEGHPISTVLGYWTCDKICESGRRGYSLTIAIKRAEVKA